MKMIFLSIATLLSVLIFASCQKREIEPTPLASIQITNAVVNGKELQFGSNPVTIPNNDHVSFGVLTGSHTLKLVVKEEPNVMYYNQTKEFVNGGIYSLFLTGTSGRIESVFLKDDSIPSHKENVFGARMINLVPGSVSISVNLQGSAPGSFIGNLPYKSISTFKEVSSLDSEGDKVFEFRNAATGDFISAFVIPGYDLPRFRNITIVFAGTVGEEKIFRNNNF